ncbi:MAG TPA: Tol-Pal system beta propeller repeat protein TolB [Terriglobales bacterium]|nr:Tol-Pal system beta propeller repeat protein TolB [Terriglobales bacterium]
MKRLLSVIISVFFCSALLAAQQDWIRTGTGLGVEKVRLAVPDFKASNGEAQTAALQKVFDDTLFYDLDHAGIFDMVSKSFMPTQIPGSPQDVNMAQWSSPPPNASMLAFGNLGVTGTNLTVQGFLYDLKNSANPQVLAKQYTDTAGQEQARSIAHKFADEIIFRLGGGINGIAETKIVFVSSRSGHKEIWEMDYDGGNQHQLTHLGTIALSPRISPDSSRVAFSAMTRSGWEIMMYSMDLGRLVHFPHFGGTNLSPAWSPDGTHLAFSSSRSGDPEIYVTDADGMGLKRLTSFAGPDVSPVWNPKTGAQIAWVERSQATRLPQISIMQSDGTNQQHVTDEGYAVSPSWSPNGQFLAFSWMRRYGPGEPGAQDIYVMDVTTHTWAQLTHGEGRNDFPSWSPDSRHIVFQSTRSGQHEIWTMLADGTQQQQLTTSGQNEEPNWSWK